MIDESRRGRLCALLDGELDPAARAALESDVAIDLPLAEEYDALASLDRTLRHTLAPLSASDEAIAAAVLERAAPPTAVPGRTTGPRSAPRGVWLGVVGLAAALLLVLRLLPPPPAESDEAWRVVRADGGLLWVREDVRMKVPADPSTELRGSGELVTLATDSAALRAPDGTEVYLAPRSGIVLGEDGPLYSHGRVWVRSTDRFSLALNGGAVTGRGSFVISEENGTVLVETLRGEAEVRVGEGAPFAIGERQFAHFGGKAPPLAMPEPYGELDLVWARTVLGEEALPGSALAELVDGHLRAIREDRVGSTALKGIAGWIGSAAAPALIDALAAPAGPDEADARQRMAWALRECFRGPVDDPLVVEPLFALPLTVEPPLVEDVLDALVSATGVPMERDLAFWTGKTSPQERVRALEEWRDRWIAARAERASEDDE